MPEKEGIGQNEHWLCTEQVKLVFTCTLYRSHLTIVPPPLPPHPSMARTTWHSPTGPPALVCSSPTPQKIHSAHRAERSF